MRLLVVGKLNGQLAAAVKMAMSAGAKVSHVESCEAATHALAGGTAFTVHAPTLPAQSISAVLDLDLALSDTATLTLGYSGAFAPGAVRQGISGELRAAF